MENASLRPCALAKRAPRGHMLPTADRCISQPPCNTPPPPTPLSDALQRLAAATLAEVRATVGIVALHAERDAAARALLSRVGDDLALIALDVEGALAVSGGDDA
jgi:hypothetical protein